MNTELQAMIDAGRKLIAEQATAEQRKTAHAVAEAERLKGIHLAKLPKWMREYVTVTHWDHSVRIYLDLLNLAADEIERLRQQLAHLDMLAAVMSDASFEEVQP